MGIGAPIAAAIFAFIADMSLAVTALLALALFVSGVLILTNLGGQGIQKHVRGAFLAILLGGLFTFGANRISTNVATYFRNQPAEQGRVSIVEQPVVWMHVVR